MTISQEKSIFTVICLFLIALISCDNPNYSDVPFIQFQNISHHTIPDLNSSRNETKDSINVKIYFEDGNGDLGLTRSDVGVSPFVAEFMSNFWVDLKVKKNGEFQYYDFADLRPFDTRFPRLAIKSGDIDGELSLNLELSDLSLVTFGKGDTILFEVRILDRELNQSNKIQTSPIVIGEGND